MGLWRWVTGRLNVSSEDYPKWKAIFGLDDDANEVVTPESALKLSTWWACKKLKQETIATLPCGMFAKDSAGDPQALSGHNLTELLRFRPNDWQTPVEFWEGRVGPLCSHGNSYAEKRFIGDRIASLEPMKVDDVSPFRDKEDGWRIKYRFTDRGKLETLPSEKVFHIRGFGDDGIEGLSPLACAARSIGAALAADRAAARLYGKGLRAPGFWKPPVDMSKEQREQFVKNYVAPAEGANGEGSGRVVMPPGFEWSSFGITPKDAELLLSRGFSVEDVCRWMTTPPILVGHASQGQTMWGSGVEQIILGWLVLGLRADLKRIEAAVNTRLLSVADRAKGIYFEFNFEGLLRADSAARAALMATLAQNGLRTRDELRKIDNYPSMGGNAAELTVQSNLVTLEQLGAQQEDAQVVRSALKNWLAGDRDNERKAA